MRPCRKVPRSRRGGSGGRSPEVAGGRGTRRTLARRAIARLWVGALRVARASARATRTTRCRRVYGQHSGWRAGSPIRTYRILAPRLRRRLNAKSARVLRVARKRLRSSDAPERPSGQGCERSGAPPFKRLRAGSSVGRVHPTQAATHGGNAIPINWMGGGLFGLRLLVGALRLLRLVGRVCDRAGNGVRCGLPNLMSLPPLPNDATVPRQFREARP